MAGKYGDKSDDNTRVQGVDPVTGDPSEITRTTDGTHQRLDVDARISGISVGPPGLSGSKLCYEDMNATTGGVARNTVITNSTWVKTYSYTGSGYALFVNMSLEEIKKWQIRIVIDSHELFGASGISTKDMDSDNLYNMDFDGDDKYGQLFANINVGLGKENTFFWSGPDDLPVTFDTSFEVYIKRISGTGNKKFRAGLVSLQKDS